MHAFDYPLENFNPKDVLECGQIFRFKPFKEGYFVCSKDKACYVYKKGFKTVVESDEPDYFYNFFDLDREYGEIIEKIKAFNVPVLTHSAEVGKGLRLLKQDAEETIFSFIISQNNNIPRIKLIIERICRALGESRQFSGEEYFTFPTAAALAKKDASFFKELGAGYRDEFLAHTARRIDAEGIDKLKSLSGESLKKELLTYKGVGPKVADCISLFGFGEATSFPVDTWIEKIYKEDFGGKLKTRKEINEYFTNLFKQYSGLVQQYLFYGKRANL